MKLGSSSSHSSFILIGKLSMTRKPGQTCQNLRYQRVAKNFVQVAKVRCATLKEWALQVDSVFIAVCI